MPELPEVETVVRGLRDTVVGKTISAVTVRAPRATIVVSRSFRDSDFAAVLVGRKVLTVIRRGKNILIGLTGEVTLWAHLKMTGHFFYMDSDAPVSRHDLVVFDFAHDKRDGTATAQQLRFNDYRRFGRLRLFRDSELFAQEGLAQLGPEPLEISAGEFVELCRGRQRMIKAALLDQSFLAGLGNIYADEALYAAKIHPKRILASVTGQKLRELHGHIGRLLRRSIRLMGTSVDSYSGVNGQSGKFQTYLKAYGNEGKCCGRCRACIVREKIGARSAHYCPRCQRLR